MNDCPKEVILYGHLKNLCGFQNVAHVACCIQPEEIAVLVAANGPALINPDTEYTRIPMEQV